NHIRSLASGIFTHAINTGRLESNPWRDVRILGKVAQPKPTDLPAILWAHRRSLAQRRVPFPPNCWRRPLLARHLSARFRIQTHRDEGWYGISSAALPYEHQTLEYLREDK